MRIYGHIKMKNQIEKIGKEVIDLQIKALKKLKNSLNTSFKDAVNKIYKCKSKVIICGVGKSGKIASKISATLSSVGTPSFSISANDCSHGDLGRITPQDILILISYSGNTDELKNIIKFSKINKIFLIGIVSNKKSYLYKTSNIKLLTPEVQESGHGIVPTSSTTTQLSLGDALAIALMKKKKFGKLDFKKYHPAGNLGNILKTAGDIMLKNEKIPFIDENEIMKIALKELNLKKLGFLVLIDKTKRVTGIFTDGDLKRLMQKKRVIGNLIIKKFASKKPFFVEKDKLASEVLIEMNNKRITNVCVYDKEDKKKIIGIIHIHTLLKALR
jgi:arabinose-5-phosphate isomerase